MHRPGPGDRRRRRTALGVSLRERLGKGPRRDSRPPLGPKEIVAGGYDAIAERYAEWAQAFVPVALPRIRRFAARLPDGARVLDLGCGGGFPASVLAERHDVFGVDISPVQVERARRAVPQATFACADATCVEFAPESFDAVVSLYMLGHIPRAEQEPLLRRAASWLRPGGLALFTMGTGGTDDEVEEDWLGAPMFFASFDAERNRELVARSGLDLLEVRQVPQNEPGHGVVSFMWILARKP